jgi:putative ABC transport system substrate-binding protein
VSGKYLELLQETVPRLSTIAVISNLTSSPYPRKLVKYLETVAHPRGVRVVVVDVREPGALTRAFRQARRQAQAALVLADPLTVTYRKEITKLAASNHLPTMYAFLVFMDARGLMAYGADVTILFRRAAEYVDKILRGVKPTDLPIEQPTSVQACPQSQGRRGARVKIPRVDPGSRG